jgi:5-aminopentanamidase
MGPKLRIGCAQYTARHGDAQNNLSTIEQLVIAAAKDAVELLVLPEMAVTGYAKPEIIVAAAEPIPGPTSNQLGAFAIQHDVAIAAGLVEKDPTTGLMHNTMLLLDRNGIEVLRYRKVHLWDTETGWAAPGTSFPVAKIYEVKVGMWICYDTRFPESARSLAKNGAQLALRSRAMDNGIFVAGSAQLGRSFYGVSMIIDPHGRIMAQGDPLKDMIISADVELDEIAKFHQRVPLLKHLQPDSYR